MASTQQKAMSATDAALQAELQRERAATRVSGCRLCPAPTLAPDGSSQRTSGRFTQGEELLSLVAEIREEVPDCTGPCQFQLWSQAWTWDCP
ncbi:uncharacterized protein ACIBXB_018377 isoform 2-T3 [Morphnus guianensis]